MKQRYMIQVTIETMSDLQFIKPFDGLWVFVSDVRMFYFWDKKEQAFMMFRPSSGEIPNMSDYYKKTETDLILNNKMNKGDEFKVKPYTGGMINPLRSEVSLTLNSSEGAFRLIATNHGVLGNNYAVKVDYEEGLPNQEFKFEYFEEYPENNNHPCIVISLATDSNGNLNNELNKPLKYINWSEFSNYFLHGSVGPITQENYFTGRIPLKKFTGGRDGDVIEKNIIKVKNGRLVYFNDNNEWATISVQ